MTYLIRVLFFLLLEFTEISKKVGIAWNSLSEEDKEVGNLIRFIYWRSTLKVHVQSLLNTPTTSPQ